MPDVEELQLSKIFFGFDNASSLLYCIPQLLLRTVMLIAKNDFCVSVHINEENEGGG